MCPILQNKRNHHGHGETNTAETTLLAFLRRDLKTFLLDNNSRLLKTDMMQLYMYTQ